MEIIQIPHPTLRKTSQKVTVVDKKLVQFTNELQQTLASATNPRGYALAAPQVNKLWRLFASQVEIPQVFINPEIINHSKEITLGPDKDQPFLESCFSIPKLFGPVYRWKWVEVQYDRIVDDKLVSRTQKFNDLYARVIQHEIDHLNGILFTDYALKYDLPVYQDLDDDKYREIDREFLEMI